MGDERNSLRLRFRLDDRRAQDEVGAKAVVTGDTSQVDLPKGSTSGLIDAENVLRDVKGIATTRFTSADVVRHPLVARIVEAYDAADAKGR